MSEEEYDEHEAMEPAAIDENGDFALVHACVMEDDEGDEIEVVHLSAVEYLGECNMKCDHHNTVTLLLSPSEALKLAGSLMAAADKIAGVVLGSSEEPSGD